MLSMEYFIQFLFLFLVFLSLFHGINITVFSGKLPRSKKIFCYFGIIVISILIVMLWYILLSCSKIYKLIIKFYN